MAFLIRIAPELTPSDRATSEVLWSLTRELDATGGFHAAPTHLSLAQSLGVEPEIVATHTRQALGPLLLQPEAQARAALDANPDHYLDAITSSIAHAHPSAIEARVQTAITAVQKWLPAEFLLTTTPPLEAQPSPT